MSLIFLQHDGYYDLSRVTICRTWRVLYEYNCRWSATRWLSPHGQLRPPLKGSCVASWVDSPPACRAPLKRGRQRLSGATPSTISFRFCLNLNYLFIHVSFSATGNSLGLRTVVCVHALLLLHSIVTSFPSSASTHRHSFVHVSVFIGPVPRRSRLPRLCYSQCLSIVPNLHS